MDDENDVFHVCGLPAFGVCAVSMQFRADPQPGNARAASFVRIVPAGGIDRGRLGESGPWPRPARNSGFAAAPGWV
jgi:hypothetical protein